MAEADLTTLRQRFWSRVDRSQGDGCWPWTASTSRNGYGKMHWRGKVRAAHRIAYALACGGLPAGLCILHHCDNPPCCNPAHLFAGTKSDNTVDAVFKGRHTHATLTPDQVREIRRLYAAGGVSQTALGRRFKVGQMAIWAVVHEVTWKRVMT